MLKIIPHRNCEVGVLASDELKLVTKKHFYIIVNSDPSDQPGTHWLAFMKRGKYLEFFDSFGKPVTFYGQNFIDFVKKHGPYLKYNTTQLQSNSSSLCGKYCLFFLAHRNLYYTYDEILSMFSKTHLEKNDYEVKKFYKIMESKKKSKKRMKCECIINSQCEQRNVRNDYNM